MTDALGPLHGVLVTDLTQAWAGAYATELLGDLGADVIKVESRRRPDIWRGGIDAYQRGFGEPGNRPFNRNSNTNSQCRNKRGITLDLSHQRGRELLIELVRRSDVIAENFTPRVMRNFRLEYAELVKHKPDIIMLSVPAYGDRGPYSEYPGVGGTIEPMSSNGSILGAPAGPPMNSGYIIPDPIGGLMGAAAVVSALESRAQGGGGQYISLSLHESMVGVIGDVILAAQHGDPVIRHGDASPQHVPHRHYKCNDGRFVAIAVESDSEWRALARLMGSRLGTQADEFTTTAQRLANRAEVDDLVASWCLEQAADELEAQLIVAGVRAGKIRTIPEVAACPQLGARAMFADVTHTELGTYRTAGPPWKLSSTPPSMRRGAPCLGEHSREILTGMLGVSEAEYEALEAAGVTGDQPPEA